MSEEKKKILIIGAGGSIGRQLGFVLDNLQSVCDVEYITAEDIERKNIQHTVILDELSPALDTVSFGRLLRRKPTAEMREFQASRRYQEPQRLRGAARQKRQAKKARNKGKR